MNYLAFLAKKSILSTGKIAPLKLGTFITLYCNFWDWFLDIGQY